MISVIVPVYNAEQYLDACMQSILNQTYVNLEIILIDDGSKDKSGKLCDKYEETDCRVHVIHKRNGGVSSARNLGLKHCKGDYIAFIDSDDIVSNKYLETLYKDMLENDADIAACDFNYIFYNKAPVKANPSVAGRKLVLNDKYNYDQYSFLLNYVWGKLFKKKLLEGVFFHTEIFVSEDSLFIAELGKKLKTIYYNESSLYMYRMHPFSEIHTDNVVKRKSMAVAWNRIRDLQEMGSNAYQWANMRYLEVCRWYAAEIWISDNRDMRKIFLLRKEVKDQKKTIWKVKISAKRKIMLLFFIYMPVIYFYIYGIKKKIFNKFHILKA